jgi:hypothetical protein
MARPGPAGNNRAVTLMHQRQAQPGIATVRVLMQSESESELRARAPLGSAPGRGLPVLKPTACQCGNSAADRTDN